MFRIGTSNVNNATPLSPKLTTLLSATPIALLSTPWETKPFVTSDLSKYPLFTSHLDAQPTIPELSFEIASQPILPTSPVNWAETGGKTKKIRINVIN